MVKLALKKLLLKEKNDDPDAKTYREAYFSTICGDIEEYLKESVARLEGFTADIDKSKAIPFHHWGRADHCRALAYALDRDIYILQLEDGNYTSVRKFVRKEKQEVTGTVLRSEVQVLVSSEVQNIHIESPFAVYQS